MKGKIFSNKKIMLLLVIACIIAICTGFITTSYKKTDNATTVTDNGKNANWNPYDAGLCADDIVKAAINEANNVNSTYSGGCITFVGQVVKRAAGASNVNITSNSCDSWNGTVNGVSIASNIKIGSNDRKLNSTPWYDTLGGIKDYTLQPGDIIVGDGHAMVYLGQGNNFDDLNSKLKSKYGISITKANFSKWNEFEGRAIKEYTNNVGSKYWTIDVNGSSSYARISNYNWSDNGGQSVDSCNLNNIKVYRFAKRSGSYHFYISKRNANNTNQALGGAKFKFEKFLNESESATTLNSNETDSPTKIDSKKLFATVTTTVSSTSKYYNSGYKATVVQIGNKQGTNTSSGNSYDIKNWETDITNVSKYDKYVISEESAPSGYIKTNKKLTVKVYKTKLDKNRFVIDKIVAKYGDGPEKEFTYSLEDNKVKNGTLYFDDDGEVVDLNSEYGSHDWRVGLEVNRGAILVKWCDTPMDGTYHMYVSKRDAKNPDNAIPGAQFKFVKKLNQTGTAATLKANESGSPTAVASDKQSAIVTTTTTENKYYINYYKATVVQIGDKAGTMHTRETDYTVGNWETSITDTSKYDTYVVTEEKAPDKYKKSDKKLIIDVYKKVKNNQYDISKIKVSFGGGKAQELVAPDSGNSTILLDDNGGVVTDESKARVHVEVNSGAIIIRWNDTPIEGSYHMYVSKRDAKNPDNAIPGAKFKFIKRLNNSGTVTDMPTGNEKGSPTAISGDKKYATVTTTTDTNSKYYNTGYKATVVQIGNKKGTHRESEISNWEVSITNSDDDNKYDEYIVTEESAPSGYIKSDKELKIKVYKTVSNNKYIIEKLIVSFGGGKEHELKRVAGENQIIRLNDSGAKVDKDSNSIVRVEVNSGAIIIRWNDTPIEGSYHMYVSKRDAKNTNKAIAGAKFKFVKYLNGATGAADLTATEAGSFTNVSDDKKSAIVTTTTNKNNYFIDKYQATVVQIGDKTGTMETRNQKIPVQYWNTSITNADDNTKYDKYDITEESAPKGYIKSNKTLTIKVFKTVSSKNDYDISMLKVSFGSGSEQNLAVPESGNGTLLLDDDGKKVEDESKARVHIEVNEGAIVVVWNDTPIEGSYHMYVSKRDAKNTNKAIAGAKFKFVKYLNGATGAADLTATEAGSFTNVSDDKKSAIVTTTTNKNNYFIDKYQATVVQIGDKTGTMETRNQEIPVQYWNTSITNADDNTKYDKYDITEESAPKGYIKSNKTLTIRVFKTVSSKNDYDISMLKVSFGGASEKDLAVPESGNGTLLLDDDGKKVEDESKARVHIEVNEGAIVVVWNDTPIEGSYHMYVSKRDATNPDKAVEGAQFKFIKKLNQSVNAETLKENESNSPTVVAKDKQSAIVTTTTNKDNYFIDYYEATVVQIGDKSGIMNTRNTDYTVDNWETSITNTDKYDEYVVTEFKAPDGYIKSDKELNIKVCKTVSNNKYIIEKLLVSFGGAEEHELKRVAGENQIIRLNDSGAEVKEDSESIVRVEVNSGAIIIRWNDKPETKLGLNIQKKKYNDTTSTTIPGVNMTVKFGKEGALATELTDEENEIFKNGKVTINKEILESGNYILEVYENTATAPFVNVFDQFNGIDGVKVKIKISEDGAVSLIQNGEYSFFPSSKNGVENSTQIEEISNYVKVNVSGSDVSVSIKDPVKYEFNLFKKKYNGESNIVNSAMFDGTAKFKIDEVSPNKGNKFGGASGEVLDGTTQSTTFTENNVIVGRRYFYEITETDVTGPNNDNSKYQRDLIGKVIRMVISVDNDGKVCTVESGKTLCKFADEEDQKKYGNLIKIAVDQNTNTVNLYIANVPNEFYNLELYKTNKEGTTIENLKATFDETFTNGSGNTKEAKGIETVNGVANLTNKEVIGEVAIEKGKTHEFNISEVNAPAGYKKLPGNIKVKVNFDADGNPTVTAKYYENDIEKSIAGLTVDYKEFSSTHSIKLYVPNESEEFNFELIKKDSEGKLLSATDNNGVLEGATFTINRLQVLSNPNAQNVAEDDGARISEIANGLLGKAFEGIIDYNDEERTPKDQLPLVGNIIYQYQIFEHETKPGYINILKDKFVLVQIYTLNDENHKPYIDKVTYSVISTSNHGMATDVTESVKSYVTAKKSEDGKTVTVTVVNPKGYKVKLNKFDTSGTPINTAVLIAEINGNKVLSMNENGLVDYSVISQDRYAIAKNEEQKWIVRELYALAPYKNILEDKYIEITVKADDNGVLSVKEYHIKDSSHNLCDELKKYVSEPKFVTEGEDKVLDIAIKNPRMLKLSISKYENGNPLKGAVILLDGKEVISGGNSYTYEELITTDNNTSREFKITESKTVANHVNYLKDKYIDLIVNISPSGNVSRSYKIKYIKDDKEVPLSDEVYDHVAIPEIEYINEIPTIDVKIDNPKTGSFNVQLVKVDENGNKIDNYNATFNVDGTVKKSKEPTNNGILDVDKGRMINDVSDTFTYQIEEDKAPTGYEKIIGIIGLNICAKENDDGTKLVVDIDNSELTFRDDGIERSTVDGKFSDENKIAWYYDEDSALIKIYVKNTMKEFDLALRKHISEVSNSNGKKINYDSGVLSRYPEINIFSKVFLLRDKTAQYYHTKQAVLVESGDTVKYKINVYNEANLKGYALEITDYIEDGLEFVSYTKDDGSINDIYGWKFYDKNGNETSNMSEAIYAKTEYLRETLLNENQIDKYILNNKEMTTWYSHVEIECKVVTKPTEDTIYLTNRAAITKDKAVEYDSNGQEIEIDVNDRDSEPETIIKKNDINNHPEDNDTMFFYDETKTYSSDGYYKGIQDDDDIDTVTIEPIKKYNFSLTKVNGENIEIDGASFIVDELINDQYEEIFNGKVNKVKTLQEPEKSKKDTVKINEVHTYKITETSSKDGYENILDGKYIVLKTYMDENGNMQKGLPGASEENLYKKHGFIVYRSDDIPCAPSDIVYERVKVSINNNVNPPVVNVTIPNDEIIEGSYRVLLNKVDENDNPIDNISFNINDENKYTQNGKIIVTEDEGENGYLAISKDSLEDSTYVIEECELNKYVRFRYPITITLSKGLSADQKSYMVTNINVAYNNTEEENIVIDTVTKTAVGTIQAEVIGGEKQDVTFSVTSDGTISIKAKNSEKQGKYSIQIQKFDENRNTLPGVKFDVKGTINAVLETKSNGYTEELTREMTEDDIEEDDIYEITEIIDNGSRYIGLKNPIILTVSKAQNPRYYVIDKYKLEEKGTENESIYDSSTGQVILEDVELLDGNHVDIISYKSSNKIVINAINPKKPSYFRIKAKKVEASTGEEVEGVKFSCKDENQIHREGITDDHGTTYIEYDKYVDREESFIYVIKEDEIPDEPEGLIKITDYNWIVRFNTKFNEETGTYVIDNNSVNAKIIAVATSSTPEMHERQRVIAQEAADSIAVSEDGIELTITVKNEKTTAYNLTLRKANAETNETINAEIDETTGIVNSGAKFTVNNEEKILGEESFTEDNILPNSTHKYIIREEKPDPEYENIFGDSAYIELNVDVDDKGKASARYEIKGQNQDEIDNAKAKIAEYEEKHNTKFVQVDENNNISLNIPNEPSVVDVDINLQKFELGKENNYLEGAEFTVKRAQPVIHDYKSEVNDVTAAFTSDDTCETLEPIVTSKNKQTNKIDSLEGVKLGATYYYQITETKTPENYESSFYSAIVKVEVKKDKTVNSSIFLVKEKASSEWNGAVAENIEGKLSAKATGNTVNVKWANQGYYVLLFTKRQFEHSIPKDANGNVKWTGMQTITGAKFTITPEGREPILDNGTISICTTFVEKNINSNTEYTYIITEDTVPEGCYRIFENMEIVLTVAVDGNGNVNSSNTKIDVRAKAGTNPTKEELKLAKECVGVSVNGQEIDVQIANKKITNTFDLRILKVTDEGTSDGALVGIPGVTFYVNGALESSGDLGLLGRGETDENGYLTIGGLKPKGRVQNFVIAEGNTPEGVTPIDGRILLDIDTTGISETDSPEEIVAKLKEQIDTDNDGVGDKSRYSVSIVDGHATEITGLSVGVQGDTVVITIPNPTKKVYFNMYKYDELHNLLKSDNGSVGAEFKVTYEENDEILNGTLIKGHVNDYRIVGPDKNYVYTIEEINAKEGFVNVLEGYELKINVATDSQGNVRETENNGKSGATYYSLVPKEGATQKYTIDEIRNNNWVKLTTISSENATTLDLYVYNPYEYKLQLNKKDKDGHTGVNKATIIAEELQTYDENHLNGINVYSLFSPNGEIESTLEAIVSTNEIKDTVCLDKKETVTSDEYLINNNIGMIPRNETARIWRIKETDVEAPYKNILGDNTIFIAAYYREQALHLAEHTEYNGEGIAISPDYKYYVIDKDGNNVTTQFDDYIEVSTEKVDGEWKVIVTIKDPMLMYLGIYKKYQSNASEPLRGANLTVSLNNQKAEVKDGEYQSELLMSEIANNGTINATIRELDTIPGFENVLKDVLLIYTFRNNEGKIGVVNAVLIDTVNGGQITGERRKEILEHITVKKFTTDEGYQAFRVFIENPTSYKFKLKKEDIDGNLLPGAKITVYSSHSGYKYLGSTDDESELEFVEEDVGPHDVIKYVITETNTVTDSAYVNKFKDSIFLTVYMVDGRPTITEKKYGVRQSGGYVIREDLEESGYAKCYITPEKAEDLTEGETQTIVLEMENPPQIKVEVEKTTSGEENNSPISNAKFTIQSQDEYEDRTNTFGKIDFVEEISKAGTYTIRVYEDEPASKKHINVLEGKYMKIDINVTADGTVEIVGEPTFYNKDTDQDFNNDVEVEEAIANQLKQYCSASVEQSNIDKLLVHVENPVSYKVKVVKVDTSNNTLNGANFMIDTITHGKIAEFTKDGGKIEHTEGWLNAGIYKYEITEQSTPGPQYDNILYGNKLVAYVKVNSDGSSVLVADMDGNEYSSNVKESQKYKVVNMRDEAIDEKTEKIIRAHCSIQRNAESDDFDEVQFTVENPINYKFDIVKTQYDADGKTVKALDGTKFTVSREGTINVLNNVDVTEDVELEEHCEDAGDTYYDIYEDSTNENGAYVNVLKEKFVRVYIRKYEDGRIEIINNNGVVDEDYFEIYQINHFGPATKINEADNTELYGYVSVDSVRGNDGVYTIKVNVNNPITMNVGVTKKQVTDNGAPIENVSIDIISDITGKHEVISEVREKTFSEGNIQPGTYNFIVKEKENPNKNYVNILEKNYAKVNITVSENGEITLNNIKFYADNENDDYTDDALITDANRNAELSKYVYAKVDKSSRINKLQIFVENPVTLNFQVEKIDMNTGKLQNAIFDIARYKGDSNVAEFAMDDASTGAEGLITFEKDKIVEPGVYRYEVSEIAPAGNQYSNILKIKDKNYKIIVYVKLNVDGTVQFVKDANGTAFIGGQKGYKYTVVGKEDNTPADSEVLSEVRKYVYITEPQNTGTTRNNMIVTVKNPVKIDIDITKTTIVDDEQIPLAGTEFSANANNNELFVDVVAKSGIEYSYDKITPGKYTFYLTESHGAEDKGFINILEGRFVAVYTEINEEGKITILNKNGQVDQNYFELYDGDYSSPASGKIIDRDTNAKLYEYISVSAEKQENNVYKLNLKVVNPERNYKVVLNKKLFNKGGDDINLEGFVFKILSEVTGDTYELTSGPDGNMSIDEKQVPVGTYRYVIVEKQPSGPEFINVLEDNAIEVKLKVNQDGTVQIVDEENRESNGKYYILDKNLDVVDFNSTVVDEYVRVDTNNNGEVPELDIYVQDPEYYNFKLIKKDKDTNQRMDGVNFTLTVYGPGDNKLETPIDLIDAKTLEVIANKTLTTKHVDIEGNEKGEDGVIEIPNILIEKSGTYTFVFHEHSTDGIFEWLYKSHAEDITIAVDITVENNEKGEAIGYKVSAPRILTGGKYVDVAGTQTTQTKAQKVSAEVTNERIKGSYDLVLTKLDKVTKQKLDGAEFDITVKKDGHEYELYEETDDVESKDIIIPGIAPSAEESAGRDMSGHCVVRNGEIKIEKIRIERPETYTIVLKETKAPQGYMLLDQAIEIEVTTDREGEYDDEKYVVRTSRLVAGDNYGLVTLTPSEYEKVEVVARNEYFDLALRKSITSVGYSDSDDGKITEEETENRVPEVKEDDKLFSNDATTAEYNHVKNHVRAYTGQEVIFTLRVYNEGEIDGYAEEITDHLPEGLEFIPDDKFNTSRGWTYDTKDPTLRTVKTTYLSKENNPNNDRFNSENNLIKALNTITGEIDYKEIEIKCKISDGVKAKTILTNIAEISDSKAEGRTSETVDRDSHTKPGANIPGTNEEMQQYKENELTDDRDTYVPGQEDDDDFEKIIVERFDLALRKYITAINEDEVLAENKEKKFTEDKAEGNSEDKVEEDSEEKAEENSEETSEENTDNDITIKYEREPRVNASALKSGESTTATYSHTKEPMEVSVGDIVTYTLEIFNEGTVSGYASLIKDDIPEGVEFVQYTEGDGSVNDIYRWKMVNENDEEVEDPKEAKYVISDYLSKDNEETVFGNLIKAYDPDTMTYIDSKYVQVQFRVICEQNYPKIITNYAQIADDSDESGKEVKDDDSTPNKWVVDENGQSEDDQDIERIRVTYMDLALRKFITGVTDAKTKETFEVTTREPKVDPTALINETGTTAKYEHTKEPVLVHTNDVVIYTLRIYNEGSKDGYATQIKDDLPDGLEYLPEHPINKEYEWELVDVNDKPVEKLEDAEYAVTNYLSKDRETEKRNNLLVAFDKPDGTKLSTPAFKDIKIAFKVTEPQTSDRILINEAQISEQTDGKGVHRKDRDSTPNKWLGEDDEDIEKVRVQYFDLALRKWVTKAIVTQNGETVVTETGHHAEDDPEDVVKVDLKKSKINSVVVKFEYKIRITNEGEIEGYAKEIKDHIPEGLRFDPADNPTWTQISDNVITTDELKDTLLKPGESAEVTVVLTWINSGSNLGIKVNIAEISKDYNDYGTKDIDSTPDNFVKGEDDIDDAPVMLTVKTGQQNLMYIILVTCAALILGFGVYDIKRMMKKNKI